MCVLLGAEWQLTYSYAKCFYTLLIEQNYRRHSCKFFLVSAGGKAWLQLVNQVWSMKARDPYMELDLHFIVKFILKETLKSRMVSLSSQESLCSQTSGLRDLSAFNYRTSNEPSTYLNICDSLRRGSLKRPQIWPVKYLQDFLRTFLHLHKNWCGWCSSQYYFVRFKVLTASFRIMPSLVASEAYHTLKLLAPKLQQYLQQECTDWVIIMDFSLALRCITLSALNILCLFAHFSPMNFLWIISFWFHVMILVIYCWKQWFLCCWADEYPFWYNVCFWHCLTAFMKF